MSPPNRKKKSKHRHPPPRYRKQAKGKTPHAADPSARDTALVREPVRPTSAHRESARPAASTLVSLDPLAPIIVRSGRPMRAHTDADPAQFPPPSTIAGCLRTTWARATDQPIGTAPARTDVVRRLLEISVAGPLLIGDDERILAPKPRDAVYIGHGESAGCVRAEPRRFEHPGGIDLPDGLLPVQLTTQEVDKPGDGPAWWSWEDLLAFRRGETVPLEQLSGNGWSPGSGDLRTHVSIDRRTGAAAGGELFQTEGLDLDASAFRTADLCSAATAEAEGPDAPKNANGASTGGLRLLARCGEALDATLVHLGGKRRLAALKPEPEEKWPSPPDGWLERIAQAGGLCLTLLTPGVFSAGYRPGWLDGTLTGNPPDAPGLTLRLRAAAVGRWQPHSGWDLAERRPKPTRKLVQAGATYWFNVIGPCDADLLAALWLASICDDPQDRLDGFGLALPGPWTPPVGDGPRS